VAVLATSKVEEDVHNGDHQQRVAYLACAIAEEMGLSEPQICGIRMAALLHDVGKLLLRPEVLDKPTRLTEIEYGMIRAHPETGYNICRAIGLPLGVADTVLQHHERLDGSGYPQGLSGEDIVQGARVLAVADVVEAMRSERPYRPAHSVDEALEQIAQESGSLFDSEVVDACLRLVHEGRWTLAF
jgi:putative nucleotidyltransferase with HDIG domain